MSNVKIKLPYTTTTTFFFFIYTIYDRLFFNIFNIK